MGNSMWRLAIAILLGLAVGTGEAAAETPAAKAPEKCLKAEVNPVTGHVFCIDPLGAAVEPPPPEAALPCKPEQSRGQWAWAPNCAPELKGM